jgi:hypothetical protein
MDKNQLHEDDQDDDLDILEQEMADSDDDRLESDQRESQDEGSDGSEENLRQLRRKRQKQRQKENMRKTRDENIILMRELAEAKERLAALEARNVNVDAYTAEQRYNSALQQVQMAENALKEAFETGDGDKAIRAQRLRENSMQLAREANALKEQLKTAIQQPVAPKMDARAESYAQNWVTDNPWFNPSGDDEDSSIARAIDEAWSREALSQGITPASEEYWDELDVRVKRRLGSVADRRKKSVPPVSGRGEASRPSTNRDESVYLSKERIEALKQANVWDDPVQRKRFIQRFKEYDRQNG